MGAPEELEELVAEYEDEVEERRIWRGIEEAERLVRGRVEAAEPLPYVGDADGWLEELLEW